MKENRRQITILEEPSNILIVDDEDAVRKLLKRELTNRGYKCCEATNTEQALDKLRLNNVALVILDIDMPRISGVKLLSTIKANHPYTAIVVATPIGSTSIGIECMKLGAYEYITKPFILEEIALVVGRTLERRGLELVRNEYQQYLEDKNEEQVKKIRESLFQAVTALAHALEAKDKYTCSHSHRVAELSVAIAKEMRLPEGSIEKIKMAGLVHDIGKIGVKDFVLNKPDKLTNEEFKHVQSHPEIGERILAPIVNDNETLKLVRNHHERYDGTGYPDQLTNTQIPLGNKILTVADAYDAMTSERPYRKAMSNEVAFTEIEHKKGTQFDPEVVTALYRLKNCNL